jgi:hypothetical protein
MRSNPYYEEDAARWERMRPNPYHREVEAEQREHERRTEEALKALTERR